MTFRQFTAYGLVAGLGLSEMQSLAPGMICDLYIYRMRYDDEQHGIKRARRQRCAD